MTPPYDETIEATLVPDGGETALFDTARRDTAVPARVSPETVRGRPVKPAPVLQPAVTDTMYAGLFGDDLDDLADGLDRLHRSESAA